LKRYYEEQLEKYKKTVEILNQEVAQEQEAKNASELAATRQEELVKSLVHEMGLYLMQQQEPAQTSQQAAQQPGQLRRQYLDSLKNKTFRHQ